jgi:hypothetical protein
MQPRDEGVYGHLQRVASNGQFARSQRAYRAYLDHGQTCETCAVDSTECATVKELWQAYQTATSQ